MKLITSFTRAIRSRFRIPLQTTLLILGLILFNTGVLVLLNIGFCLLCGGVSLIAIALLINYERKE